MYTHMYIAVCRVSTGIPPALPRDQEPSAPRPRKTEPRQRGNDLNPIALGLTMAIAASCNRNSSSSSNNSSSSSNSSS